MPWLYEEDGITPVLKETADGKKVPVYSGSDGEKPWEDPDGFMRQLSSANSEAQRRKERVRELQARVEQFGPLADLIGEDMEPADFAREHKRLQRELASAPKGGELADDIKAKIANLNKLEEELEEARAAAAGKDKEVTRLSETLTEREKQLRRLTVGRSIRTSKWFASQNGNSSLSTLHPDQAEDYFTPYGAPDPDDPRKVVFYKTREGAAKRDATEVIRGDDGQPADVDTAIEVLGPTFGWWSNYVRPSGATGSEADNITGSPTITAKLTKADLKDDAKLIAYAKKYGPEAAENEMKRLLAAP